MTIRRTHHLFTAALLLAMALMSILLRGHLVAATPPAVPTGLAVADTQAGGQLLISWDPHLEPGVTFTVHRSLEPLAMYTPIASGLAANSYLDAGLTNGVTYYYKVQAVLGADVSDLTGEVPGRPTDSTPPPAPAGFAVADPGTGRRLNLSWTAVAASDLSAYYIYRDTSATGTFAAVFGPITGTSYSDTSVSDGVTYYYQIKAVDHSGNHSAPASASGFATDVTPPAVPSGLTITDPQIGTKLDLKWTSNAEGDLAGYNIFRSATAGGPYAKINASLVAGNNYTDTGLTRNATYYYTLQAVDQTGNASAQGTEVSGIPVDLTPPLAPTELTITDMWTGTDLNLSWTLNPFPEDDLAGYNLYHGPASNGPWTKVNGATLIHKLTTSFLNAGLARHQVAYYYISAVDETGNETAVPLTLPSRTPIDKTPPAIPTNLVPLEPGTGTRLTPKWDPNTEDDLWGSYVYRSTTGEFGTYTVINPGAPVIGTTLDDNAVTVGEAYWYRISAIDNDGNESQQSGAMVSSPTDRQAPQVPTGLTVTDTGWGQALRLQWSPKPGGDDAVGYNIYYTADPVAGVVSRANGPILVQVPETQYVHDRDPYAPAGSAPLVNDVPMYYALTALDKWGNESARTAWVSGIPTDQTPPKVADTLPLPSEPQWGTKQSIQVIFDRQMDPATITNASLSLVVKASGTPVAGLSVTYDPAKNTAAWAIPAGTPLAVSTKYTATLNVGPTSKWGRPAAGLPYSWEFTTGKATFTSPHGNYLAATNACASCHTTHLGPAQDLLQRDETSTCFYCHDGSASGNAKSTYTTKDDFSGTPASIHPVVNVPSAQSKQTIKCSDCHNAHGDVDGATSQLYPFLLRGPDRTKGVKGSGTHKDNAFCLTCHGPNNRNYSTYYNDTAGDHTNAYAEHYKSSKITRDGTNIYCLSCHSEHSSSSYKSLLKASEENVCFTCHNSASNSANSRNIADEFSLTTKNSRHNIYTTGPGAAPNTPKVECSSCHGPHTASKNSYATAGNITDSQLSDPTNTKQDWMSSNNPTNKAAAYTGATLSNVKITEFCLVCHSNKPLPTQALNATKRVPYDVLFQNRVVTTNAGGNTGNVAQQGWDKSKFLQSGHYTGGKLSCASCHNSHGSSYSLLTNAPEDSAANVGDNAAVKAAGVCGQCHMTTTPTIAGGSNLFVDLTRNVSVVDEYKHPVLAVTGKHSDTEDYSTVNNTTVPNRHSGCMDCHDPHSAQKFQSTTGGELLNQLNVSGVNVTNWPTLSGWTTTSTNNFANWNNQLSTAGIGSGTPTFTAINPITIGWQLCLKCHSYYSYRNTPPTPSGATGPQTDQTKEFNPYNAAGHFVVSGVGGQVPKLSLRTTITPGFVTPGTNPTSKDSHGNPWSASSIMVCQDCHRSDDAAATRGPHGSSNRWILRAPYVPTDAATAKSGTGTTGTEGHLCFICHDWAVYGKGASATTTGYKSGSTNLHGKHVGKGYGCTACHIIIPHGWNQRAMLGNMNTATGGTGGRNTPYTSTSWLEIQSWPASGSWSASNCNHGPLATVPGGPRCR